MTPHDLRNAMDPDTSHARVITRSGKVYLVHEDQLEGLDHDGMVYGAPESPHRRDRITARWVHLRNLTTA